MFAAIPGHEPAFAARLPRADTQVPELRCPGPVLVRVVDVLDVGVSLQSQLEVLSDDGSRRPVAPGPAVDGSEIRGNNAQEDPVLEPGTARFPRFAVQDAGDGIMYMIFLDKIPPAVRLGSILELQDYETRRGVILATAESAHVLKEGSDPTAKAVENRIRRILESKGPSDAIRRG